MVTSDYKQSHFMLNLCYFSHIYIKRKWRLKISMCNRPSNSSCSPLPAWGYCLVGVGWGDTSIWNINKSVSLNFLKSERKKKYVWAILDRFIWIPLPIPVNPPPNKWSLSLYSWRITSASFYKNKTVGDCVPIGLNVYMQQIGGELLPPLRCWIEAFIMNLSYTECRRLDTKAKKSFCPFIPWFVPLSFTHLFIHSTINIYWALPVKPALCQGLGIQW